MSRPRCTARVWPAFYGAALSALLLLASVSAQAQVANVLSIVPNPPTVIESGTVTYNVSIDAMAGASSFSVGGAFTFDTCLSGTLAPDTQVAAATVDGSPDGSFICNEAAFNTFSCQPDTSAGPGFLPVGQVSFSVTANVSSSCTFNLPDTVNLDMDCGGQCQSEPVTASVDILGAPPATLQLDGILDPPNPAPGAPFEYVIDVTNTSANDTNGPFQVEVDSAGINIGPSPDTANWSCSGTSGNGQICDYVGPAPLGGGQTAPQLRLPANAPTPLGEFSSTANLFATSPDTATGSPLVISGATGASLQVTMSAPPDPTPVGGTLEYVITVANEDRATPDDGAEVSDLRVDFDICENTGGTAQLISSSGSNWGACQAPLFKGRRVKGCVTSVSVTCPYNAALAAGQSTPALTILVSTPTSAPNGVSADAFPNASNYLSAVGDGASVFTGIAPSTDLSISKSASATAVTVGDGLTYTLDIANAGPSGIDSGYFTVTDTLPPEVTFLSFGAVSTDIICSEAGGTVTCNYNGSPISPPYNASIEINVTAAAPGNATNTADIAANPPALDTVTGNNTDSVVVAISPQPADLSLTKTGPAASPMVGNNFDYNLQVTNNGPGTVFEFTLTDTLAAETSFVSATGPDFTCPPPAGNTLTCTYADTTGAGLTPSGTANLTLTVRADAEGSATNTASVSGALDGGGFAVADPNGANDSATATLTIAPAPMASISVDVIDDPDPVAIGGQFSLTANLTNGGPAAANNLFVGFALAPGVTYLPQVQKGTTGLVWSCFLGNPIKGGGGDVVSCSTPGPLNVSQSTSVTINLQAPNAAGPVSTGVTVTADEFGPASFSETTGVGTSVDLAVSKTASATTVPRGEDFSYRLQVTNNNGLATGVQLQDTLPAGLSLREISALSSEWVCSQVRNSVSCNLQRVLGSGESASLSLLVTAPDQSGTLTNTARVTSDQDDLNASNNSDSVDVVVGVPAEVDLVLSKTSLPAAVVATGSFQYAFQVSNTDGVPASDVQIVDALPAGVTFVSASGSGWTCSASDGVLTCDLSGRIPVGDASDLLVDVTAPETEGMIRNSATVTSLENDRDTTDNTATAETTIQSLVQADLTLSKSVDLASARTNDFLTYTLEVDNAGPGEAAGVRVEDVLPEGLTAIEVVTAPGWNCQITGTAVGCDLMGNLPVDQTRSIVIRSRVAASSGTLENRATVSSTTIDPNPGGDAGSAATQIAGGALEADLEVRVADSVDPVLTDDPLDYQITVINNGPARAQDFEVFGDLPPNVAVTGVLADDGLDCATDSGRLACSSQGLLEPTDELSVILSVTAPSEATELAFTVEVRNVGLGLDGTPGNNTATEQTAVRVTPEVGDIEDALNREIGDIDDPVVIENIPPLAALCADPPPDLVELCRGIVDALEDGRGGEVAEVIRQIVGRQTQTQHTSLVEANGIQFQNVQQRLTQNRNGGGSGVTMNGLNFRYGNESIAMSYLQAAETDEPRIESGGLVQPWGFFVTGTISGGDKDGTDREIGFDFDTRGLTAGLDYRFSTRFIGGAAIGYADYESDMTDGGELQSDGITGHLFASFYPSERLYLDALLSFGSMDFEQLRPIRFTLGDLEVDDLARGAADSDQLSGALSLGYNYNRNGWNFTPSASVSYMDADIDPFTEQGTFLALEYDEQNIESLVFSANLSVSKVISLARGVLTPTLDLAYHHESQNDETGFNSRIIGASAAASFILNSDDPDRNYGSAGVGLVFVGANGRQAFLSYRNILGLSGFSRWTVNAGVRFEF